MAFQFTSTSSLVSSSPVHEFSGLRSFTACCWLKMNAGALTRDQTVFIVGSAFDANASFLLWRDYSGFDSGRNNTLTVQVRTDGGIKKIEGTSGVLKDTVWRHVAAVFESGQASGLRLYIDGEMLPITASTAGAGGIVAGDEFLRIAQSFPSKEFDSSIAEAAVFMSPLSGAEVTTLSRGVSPLCLTHRLPNLLLYQDLIRNHNHPAIGQSTDLIGAASVVDHPRVWLPTLGRVAPVAAQIKLSLRAVAATSRIATSEAAQARASGIQETSYGLAGEVVC